MHTPTITNQKQILVFIFVSLLSVTLATKSEALEFIVDQTGDTHSISEAIASASSGDTIRIRKGVYKEGELIIAKSLTIIGETGAIIDGENIHPILTLRAPNILVKNLFLRNAGSNGVRDNAAIRADEAEHCIIENNILQNNYFGIYLARAHHCKVRNNTVSGPGGTESLAANGIHLWNSNDVEIRDNIVENHRDGIYFEFVQNAEVLYNTSRNNLRYALHFMFSDNCIYTDNNFINNGAGVAVMYTKRVLIERNRFIKNWGSAAYGILLKEISDSTIVNNLFEKNSTALLIEGGSRLKIEKNDFLSNGWAIRIMGSSAKNVFNQNNFLTNSIDVSSNGSRSDNEFSANYWDKYRGYDLNRDGIGDVPFPSVRLFAYLLEQNQQLLILHRSIFIQIIDTAERVLPIFTPNLLVDEKPSMKRFN